MKQYSPSLEERSITDLKRSIIDIETTMRPESPYYSTAIEMARDMRNTLRDKVNKYAKHIDWHKTWDELTIDEKANYCGLKEIGMYMESMKDKMTALYNSDKNIVDNRGIELLWLYQ